MPTTLLQGLLKRSQQWESPIVYICKLHSPLEKLKDNIHVPLSSGVAKGGPGGAHAPQKFAVPPHVPPQMRSVLCIKIYQKIFKKYNAADKPNGMKYDCIRIHALHGSVITNVIIQSTAIASLPATSFPGSYLRSSGEMTRC